MMSTEMTTGYNHDEQRTRQAVGHAHSGEDGVKRKDDVDDGDLHNDVAQRFFEFAVFALALHRIGAFEFVANLRSTFVQQEQTARNEYQALARKPGVNPVQINIEPRFFHSNEPGNTEQQADAHHHSQQQTDVGSSGPLGRRQLFRSDGNEDDVVNTEYNFQKCKGEQAHPGTGIAPKRHFKCHGCVVF